MKSILDQDTYKISMGAAVLMLYPKTVVKYKFTDRKPLIPWTEEAVNVLQGKINDLSKLFLTNEEKEWGINAMPWINPGFWDFLANYRFNQNEVKLWLKDGKLSIDIEGLWIRTIFWEVPLMALVCETYYEVLDKAWSEDGQEEKMIKKVNYLAKNNVKWADFGTRRRRNFAAQERVVRIAKSFHNFTGTSNMYLAFKHGVKATGTMAHEWIMGHAALFSLRHANRYALQAWNNVYKGDLGTALPDTYGTDAFLNDFDGVLARLFDSVRHDSGDPYVWAEKMINHYKKLGISGKTLGFTDGNTVETAVEINEWLKTKNMPCWFGIGTSMSNDYDTKSLSIVIKLVEVDNIKVVKLSDQPEKASGDADAIRVAKWTHFNTPL